MIKIECRDDSAKSMGTIYTIFSDDDMRLTSSMKANAGDGHATIITCMNLPYTSFIIGLRML